ncbi:hypothetical protein AOQ84DRAFT_76948 [Glonium stellatum]|uniref:F-box domain-containing protein n=1 Tax=Glonium stellatum TaxID=574774 RepID=A0A8E2JY54_9PEZI|nr:hypothetical protein AOQ84DRAFT_76948 [Glonium stellatum]
MCERRRSHSEPSDSSILPFLGMCKNLSRARSFSEPNQPKAPTERCCLLELPVELRLMIYDYLLISPHVLASRTSKKQKPYGLSLSILCVNRFLNFEASAVFYQNNIFHFGSRHQPELADLSKDGQLDPPIPRAHWHSLRNLSIDLMGTHETAPIEPSREPVSWTRDDMSCEAYVRSLTILLESCGPHLGSLKLTANVGRSDVDRKSVGSFFIYDRDRSFVRALAALKISKVSMYFDFPDAFFYADVDTKAFLSRSIPLMACQIMFCQAQTKIDRLLASFGTSISLSKQTERIDLSPMVLKTWKYSCPANYGATKNPADEPVNPR